MDVSNSVISTLRAYFSSDFDGVLCNEFLRKMHTLGALAWKREVLHYRVIRSLVLGVCFLDRCLSFFFWPLCCMSLFDLPILIIPLVSSNSSYLNSIPIFNPFSSKSPQCAKKNVSNSVIPTLKTYFSSDFDGVLCNTFLRKMHSVII
jgi:hypothetical protein